jgi:hypothetical protein
MSARIVPCDSCGSPIRDSELESGQAVTLLGKKYCSGCKAEAIQSVSLDQLSGTAPAVPPAAPPAKKAAAAPKPAVSRSAPARPAPVPAAPPAPAPSKAERKAPARRPATPAAAAPSRMPLIAGLAGVVILLVAAAAYFVLRDTSAPVSTTTRTPAAGPAPSAPGPAPEAKAREAFLQVQELAGRAGTSSEVILAAAEKARGVCKGTAFEKPLDGILTKAQRDKESEDAARDLAPLIDELKGAVATDSEFKRYSELQPKFQLAIETAAKSASPRVNDIRSLQNDYNTRYEKLAEPYYTDIHEAAVALADERRYDDAIRKIETFPQQFRNSGTWATLVKLRQDIERRKKK